MSVLTLVALLSACAPPCTDNPACLALTDADGDGIPAADDCDDTDPNVTTGATYYADCDGDGVTGPVTVESCLLPVDPPCEGGFWRGVDEPHGDCDDLNPLATVEEDWSPDCDNDGVYGAPQVSCGEPGAEQTRLICGVDEVPWAATITVASRDCDDGDSATGAPWWVPDCDGDGVFEDAPSFTCEAPQGACDGREPIGGWSQTASVSYDCDGTNPLVGAPQIRYPDGDGDGVFDDDAVTGCFPPPDACNGGAPSGGWTTDAPVTFDCDTSDASGGDPDQAWFPDCDGDGAFDISSVLACLPPADGCNPNGVPSPAWATSAPAIPDCDDSDLDRSPNLTEVTGDGIDNDCDEATPDAVTDLDGDGVATTDVPPDCDDGDRTIYPGAPDAYNDGIDSDCDGVDTWDVTTPGLGLYVAKFGQNGATGTAADPFLTVAEAVSTAAPGDTIYIGEGLYVETVSGQVSLIGGFNNGTAGNRLWLYDPAAHLTTISAGSGVTTPAVTLVLGPVSQQITGLHLDADGTALQVGVNGAWSGTFPLAMDQVTITGTAHLVGMHGFVSNSHLTGQSDRAAYLTGPNADVTFRFDTLDNAFPDAPGLGGGLMARLQARADVTDSVLGRAYIALQAPDAGTRVTLERVTVSSRNSGMDSVGGSIKIVDSVVAGFGTGVDLGNGAHLEAVRSIITASGTGAGAVQGVFAAHGSTATLISSVVRAGAAGTGFLDISAGVACNLTSGLTVVNSYVAASAGALSFAAQISCNGPVVLHGNILDGGVGAQSAAVFESSATSVQLTSNFFENHGDSLVATGDTPFVATGITDLAVVEQCVHSGCTQATGGVVGNALLASPDASPAVPADFIPDANSPVIDASTPPTVVHSEVNIDLDLRTRPQGAAWDMGPIEQ